MTQPLTDAEREEARRLAEYVLAGGIADHRHELARAVLALDGEVERLRGGDEKQSGALDLESFEREAARARRHWGHSTINDAYAEDVRTLCREVRRLRARAEAAAREAARQKRHNALLTDSIRQAHERRKQLQSMIEKRDARVRELEAEVARERTWRNECSGTQAEILAGELRKARAHAERLERAVREAPHVPGCPRACDLIKAHGGCTLCEAKACDCWKAKALEEGRNG